MKDLAGAVIAQEDYAEFALQCRKADDRFPATYAEWERLIDEATSLAIADGRRIDPIVVDLDEFHVWCARATVHPCLDAMRAFMIVKRRGMMKRESDGPGAPAASLGQRLTQ